MFSCCLPVSRGRALKRGSNESRFRSRRRRRFGTQPRPLSPLTRLEPESSTPVLEEQQLVHEDPSPAFTIEGQVNHTTEGQSRPAVHMASWGNGGQGPLSGQRCSPLQKPIRFHRPPSWKLLSQQRQIALCNPFLEPPRLQRRFPMCDAYLEHQAHVNHTGPEDLQAQEAVPKAPAQEAEKTPVVTREAHPEVPEAELGCCTSRGPATSISHSSCSCGARLAWEAPPDMTEAPPPLEEEPYLDPALDPASGEELPPENLAGPAPAPEPLAETARRLPSEKHVLPSPR